MSKTFVVIGQHCWGRGESLVEAKYNFRREGALLSLGYTVVEFDEETEFKGVDGMGRVHWLGNEPTMTEHPPVKSKARS